MFFTSIWTWLKNSKVGITVVTIISAIVGFLFWLKGVKRQARREVIYDLKDEQAKQKKARRRKEEEIRKRMQSYADDPMFDSWDNVERVRREKGKIRI